MSHAVCASVARPAVCAALARAARPVSTTKPARPNLVRTRVAEVETSYDNATIDLTISTDEARVCFQFDKAVLNANEGPVIFVTGVAIGCAAETAGVVPGQRLVALSDPINKGELWFLDGTERLAFVLVRLSQAPRSAFAIAHTRPAKGALRPEGTVIPIPHTMEYSIPFPIPHTNPGYTRHDRLTLFVYKNRMRLEARARTK